MTREEAFERLTSVFREVFDDDEIELNDATTSEDIEEWDSLMHITLMLAVGSEFSFKVPISKVNSMKNVGQMVDLIIEMGK